MTARSDGQPAFSMEPNAIRDFALGRMPRIEFGAGRFGLVPDIVAAHGRRALLVTGRRSFRESPRHAWLVSALAARDVELLGEVAIAGEPDPTTVDKAVARFRPASVDVVLGIGGGGALDAAKAIAGLLRTATSVRDHLEGVGNVPYAGPAVPLVAVPTTAGTGSEATRNAVLTERGDAGFKRSFRDERLVAAEAVVDPDLLEGAPRPLIAADGMDALTQLLEAYLSPRASPITDALALVGLAAVSDGLLAWYRDPEGGAAPAARSQMAFAALLSGICLANAGLGAVHGLASPLGAYFPIPHGAACGAVLSATVALNIRALEEAGARSRGPGSLCAGRADARLARPGDSRPRVASYPDRPAADVGRGAGDPAARRLRCHRCGRAAHRGGKPRQLDAHQPDCARGLGDRPDRPREPLSSASTQMTSDDTRAAPRSGEFVRAACLRPLAVIRG